MKSIPMLGPLVFFYFMIHLIQKFNPKSNIFVIGSSEGIDRHQHEEQEAYESEGKRMENKETSIMSDVPHFTEMNNKLPSATSEKKKIRARRGKAIVSKRKRNKTLISSRPTRKTRRRSSSQATITKKGKQPRTLISSRTTTRGPPKKGSYHLNQHGDGGFDDRDNEETYQQLLPAQKGKGTHIIGGKGVPAALGPSIQPYHIDRHTGRIYYDYELIPIRQCVVFRSDVMVGGISTIGSTSDRGGAVAKGAVAKGAVLTHPPYSPRSVSHDSFYDDISLGDEQETRTEYDGRGGGGW